MDRTDDRSGGDASVVGTGSGADTAGPFHTSELRWFARGPLPRDIRTWFTIGGTAGGVEDRHDTYQLHGLNDIGVKRRHCATLEVKVCMKAGPSLSLGDGLECRIEEWSRWEPGEDDGIWQSPEAPWIDVHKVIYTRSFLPPDREVVLPVLHRNALFAGCDIEVAEVTVGEIDTWSLALEAFGPTTERRHALVASWSTLLARSPSIESPGFAFDRACGYPEWLRLVTSGQPGTDQRPRPPANCQQPVHR